MFCCVFLLSTSIIYFPYFKIVFISVFLVYSSQKTDSVIVKRLDNTRCVALYQKRLKSATLKSVTDRI
jgi:hypothetical protein